MTRRCSHCSNNGHNSRTCPNRGVRLFGVRLTDGSIRKSASMGNLTHYASSNSGGNSGGATPVNGVVSAHDSPGDTPDHASAVGYASEDFVAGSSSTRERKKGVPWTEEEHKMFLLGLQKLGKGDWRGISRNYVITRTPTQVASHAQKYFIRHSNISRRKRRSSLFDIVAEESVDSEVVPRDFISMNSQQMETQSNDSLPAALPNDEAGELMDSSNATDVEATVNNAESSQNSYPVVYPAYVAPFFPLYPIWAGYNVEQAKEGTHEVLKPTAVHSKTPLNVDELLGISQLSLGESVGVAQPPSLSLNLAEGSTRQSAFQPNPTSGSSSMTNSSHNPIHAV